MGKCLKEKCYPEQYQQLSFNSSCKIILYFTFSVKSIKVADNNLNSSSWVLMGKYLKEKCYPERYQQLSFNFFCKIMLYFQVIIKSLQVADDNFFSIYWPAHDGVWDESCHMEGGEDYSEEVLRGVEARTDVEPQRRQNHNWNRQERIKSGGNQALQLGAYLFW